MFLKKAVLAVFLIIFTSVSALWAGDSAIFVDLGFSPDGRTFMFGQYGVKSSSLYPWAEIYVVDVTGNNFVPGGRASLTQPSAIKAGQDGRGVFLQLVAANSSLINRYNINNQNQGLPLYISREENPPAYGETITFRDFLSGNKYEAKLIPTITGGGRNVRSQFYIDLSVNSKGQVKPYRVGNSHVTRNGIAQYNIKRVVINDGGNSIIFVIEMKRVVSDGFEIRYMVEAVQL